MSEVATITISQVSTRELIKKLLIAGLDNQEILVSLLVSQNALRPKKVKPKTLQTQDTVAQYGGCVIQSRTCPCACSKPRYYSSEIRNPDGSMRDAALLGRPRGLRMVSLNFSIQSSLPLSVRILSSCGCRLSSSNTLPQRSEFAARRPCCTLNNSPLCER